AHGGFHSASETLRTRHAPSTLRVPLPRERGRTPLTSRWGYGSTIRPPVIAVATPVVPGKLIGRPRAVRAAR
ncbi:MAG: hypothetical protein JWO72_1981, partial [Caulobacteraceae bacterium]|nr:hypothetical protein [Caulobacteraceae bacterium]